MLLVRLKQFVSVWQTITFDYSTCILSSIKGVKIEFVDYPKQTMIPREYNFDATEFVIIDKQIEKFLQTGVIETTKIFIRPKKDGSYRLILNLKNLNQFVQYHHRHISHYCLVPAIGSHTVTHCTRRRLVRFIILFCMHAVV